MKVIAVLILASLSIFSVTGCGDVNTISPAAEKSADPAAKSSAKDIKTFALNGFAGIMSDSYIIVSMPAGTTYDDLYDIAATFTTNAESVTVDGVKQVSGETSNDFTDPVVYKVTAADGSTREYMVNVFVANMAISVTETRQGIGANITEVQSITLTGAGADSTWTMSFNGNTSASFSEISLTAVDTALRSLPSLADISVSQGIDSNTFIITLTGVIGDAPAVSAKATWQQMVTHCMAFHPLNCWETLDTFEKNISATEVTKGFAVQSAIQMVKINGTAIGGKWFLTHGTDSTVNLACNIDAPTLQTELRKLPGLELVTVTGDTAAGFSVTFTGVSGPVDLLVATSLLFAIN